MYVTVILDSAAYLYVQADLDCGSISRDDRYPVFELIRNEQISADGWYQGVWHFEFQCWDDIACVLFYVLEEG